MTLVGSQNPFSSETRPRLYSKAIQPVYQSDLTDKWCVGGLGELHLELSKPGTDYPMPAQRSPPAMRPGSDNVRVQDLANAVEGMAPPSLARVPGRRSQEIRDEHIRPANEYEDKNHDWVRDSGRPPVPAIEAASNTDERPRPAPPLTEEARLIREELEHLRAERLVTANDQRSLQEARNHTLRKTEALVSQQNQFMERSKYLESLIQNVEESGRPHKDKKESRK